MAFQKDSTLVAAEAIDDGEKGNESKQGTTTFFTRVKSYLTKLNTHKHWPTPQSQQHNRHVTRFLPFN